VARAAQLKAHLPHLLSPSRASLRAAMAATSDESRPPDSSTPGGRVGVGVGVTRGRDGGRAGGRDDAPHLAAGHAAHRALRAAPRRDRPPTARQPNSRVTARPAPPAPNPKTPRNSQSTPPPITPTEGHVAHHALLHRRLEGLAQDHGVVRRRRRDGGDRLFVFGEQRGGGARRVWVRGFRGVLGAAPRPGGRESDAAAAPLHPRRVGRRARRRRAARRRARARTTRKRARARLAGRIFPPRSLCRTLGCSSA
jgi:hypothetical protein